MIVTLRAPGRKSQPHRADGVGSVYHLLKAKLVDFGPALAVRQRVAVKPGSYFLIHRGIGQKVARDLLYRELVERHVGVECFNHPVPIPPGMRTDPIHFVAVTVGVAGKVEPVFGPFLAVVLGIQKSIDESLISVGTIIGEKPLDSFRGRRKPDQVQMHSPHQSRFFGFGRWLDAFLLKTCQDKSVHWIFGPSSFLDRRRPRSPNELKCPMA